MAGHEGPEYGRSPLSGLVVGVIAPIPVAVIVYELWPQPIPAVLLGLASGLVPTFFLWRGSALPITVSLDDEALHAQKRRRRAVLISLALLSVAAVALWPFRR